MTKIQTKHRSEQGFTLVELAIVMVIIGLLIGGILKGQELIANAEVSATISQLKGLDAAMNTFQDKYNALAGDMDDTVDRLPGGANNFDGDGNGRIDDIAGALPTNASEGVRVFVQLSLADLISGIVPTGGAVFGERLPTVKAGGGMWLGTANANGSATGVGANTLRGNGVYASILGQPIAYAPAAGAISVVSTAQIDRKMDDGAPNTGSFIARCVGGAGGGANGANPEYTENANSACAIYARVMN